MIKPGPEADPGFKKEGAQGVRGLALNLGGFLKNLAQKGVGVRPQRPPRAGSAHVGL